MIILHCYVGKKLLPYEGSLKHVILFHNMNWRTPLPPMYQDWHNLWDLPTEYEQTHCWKCGIETKDFTCPVCKSYKFLNFNQ